MKNSLSLLKRPRRNRKSSAIRALVQENHLRASDLIAPYFVTEGKQIRSSISSLPDHYHLSLDYLEKEIESLLSLGIHSVLLFALVNPKHKDELGSYALNPDNHIYKTISFLKERHPDLCVITDIALDPFTSHGHDGLISSSNEILNDETVDVLSQMCLLCAQAGVDVVAPSDMMDGRIKAIRQTLDANQFQNVSIMSYTAKYASALYGPFRDALMSAPSFGDKKTYQMNPSNIREALLEAELDEEEGADFLMVKPATFYLDVISKIKSQSHLPLVAYHVSGEYAMIKAAAQNRWIDFEKVLLEALLSIKRAGADIIISYGAKEAAKFLKK